MTVQEIAEIYLEARKKRAQAKELSNVALGRKFECGAWVISRAINRMPCRLSEEDQDLVRQCVAERERLEAEAGNNTMAGLCRRHKIGQEKLIGALVQMGKWGAA